MIEILLPFITKDYSGAPFVLFSPPHLLALSIVLGVNLLLPVLRNHSRAQTVFRWSLAVILVVNESLWHAWNWYTGQWSIQTMLPFHICSILVWLSAYMLVKRSYPIYEFAYFLGIAGATQALLTPDAGIYGFPHFRAFQTFISHGSIVTAAVYMTTVEGLRPTWKSIQRVLVGMNIYMGGVAVINTLIGSNYLYIAHKPETASLIDVLGPWPWYILSLEAIGLVLCLVLYLPFFMKDRMAKPFATERAAL